MTQTRPFRDVLEAADSLTPDDQQVLIDILHRRLVAAGRKRIIDEVR